MVRHNDTRWLPNVPPQRLHVRYAAANLFAAACGLNTAHRSANGGHYWRADQVEEYAAAAGLFVP